MNFRLIAVSAWTLGSTFSGVAQLSLESLGEPFDGRNVEIIWAVQTNRLPSSLDTFKVLPASFSSAVISNVICLGKFKEPDKVHAFFGSAGDGKDVSYQEPHPAKPVFGNPPRAAAKRATARPSNAHGDGSGTAPAATWAPIKAVMLLSVAPPTA